MTANLIIALLAGRPVEHVHGLNNRVLAEFTFDVQQSPRCTASFRTLVRHTMASCSPEPVLRVVAPHWQQRTGRAARSAYPPPIPVGVATSSAVTFSLRTSRRESAKPAEQPIDRSTNR